MRLFYAWFLHPENRTTGEHLIAGVRAEYPDLVRSVPSGTHHLTVAFLGDVADEDVESCREVLRIAGGCDAFRVRLGDPRVLYARKTPRLICTDLTQGARKFGDLQERIGRGLQKVFPHIDVRAKPPHVTLGRFRRNAHPGSGARVEEALENLKNRARWLDERLEVVHLVRSVLTSSGPIYENIAESKLADHPEW